MGMSKLNFSKTNAGPVTSLYQNGKFMRQAKINVEKLSALDHDEGLEFLKQKVSVIKKFEGFPPPQPLPKIAESTPPKVTKRPTGALEESTPGSATNIKEQPRE